MPRLVLILILIGFAMPLEASAATVQSDGATRSGDCRGDEAGVIGSRNVVSFIGNCRALSVRGDGNIITIELAPGAGLNVVGSANRVRYTLGALPAVQVNGSAVDVGRVDGPAPPAPPIALTGEGQVLDIDCAGRDAIIRGSRSDYALRGGCRSLTVSGANTRVRAELLPGARVVVDGNDTTVAYTVLGGGTADVAAHGARSWAVADGTVAPTAAASAEIRSQPASAIDDVPLPQLASALAAGSDDAVPLPAPPAAAMVPPSDPELALLKNGTPRLRALLHQLGAQVVADGTHIAVAADLVFRPGSDALSQGGDATLRQIVQLATLIHPSAARLAIADPGDADFATRRAEALGAWFSANGLAVREADVSTGAQASAVEVLLAR